MLLGGVVFVFQQKMCVWGKRSGNQTGIGTQWGVPSGVEGVQKGVLELLFFQAENHGASCLKQCCAICPAKEELHFWVQNLRSGESQLVKRGKA